MAISQLLRLDVLYRLVPQLTPLDFYFLKCGALTRWDEKNFFFQNFVFRLSGLIDPLENDSAKKKLGSDAAWSS